MRRRRRADALAVARHEARRILDGDVHGEVPVFDAAQRIHRALSLCTWREFEPWMSHRRWPRRLERLLEGNLSDVERRGVGRFVEGWQASGPTAESEIVAAAWDLLGRPETLRPRSS